MSMPPLTLRKRRAMTVKTKRLMLGLVMAVGILMATTVCASAADYSFSTGGNTDYYGSTSYEDIYDVPYVYGGPNVADFQNPALPYGNPSTTRMGVMEKPPVVGQEIRAAGITFGTGVEVFYPGITVSDPVAPVLPQPAFTSVEGMKRSDGSIGTIHIPSLNLTRKVWEGETAASMSKGVGHYSSTSGWDGNVGVCGHNRGSTYVIGTIKDLKVGDTIIYTTVYGTRTYKVAFVKTISNTDWSYLQATADNRLTLTTCLANHPESRVCVQAVEG